MHMLSSMASAPGTGQVEEHRRGVCSGQGDGVYAVKHGECAGVWWQGR